MNKQKIFLSWKWVDEQLNAIGEQIDTFHNLGHEVKFVAGIPRGGLIPAIMISHRYGLKFLDYTYACNLPQKTKEQILVVDDISDSGETLKEAVTLGFKTATLAVRKGTETFPTFSGSYITSDEWLVFPWESPNSKSVQDYLGSE